MVIDAEGRVAARIIGEINAATLYGVVEDVLGEELRSPGGTGGAGAQEEGA